MYLIDTSIWVDYFRESNNTAIKKFQKILDTQEDFGITSFIYQEILQGAASETDFNQLVDYFKTQKFFYPKNNLSTYEKAAQLYFNCRRKGITIRSSIDCLIAQIAIENNLILVHNDKDFIHLQKILPKLKLW
jgi:predicted nucleic acid-binding protein